MGLLKCKEGFDGFVFKLVKFINDMWFFKRVKGSDLIKDFNKKGDVKLLKLFILVIFLIKEEELLFFRGGVSVLIFFE